MIPRWGLLVFGLFLSDATYAIVDMRNGNFTNTWVDARVAGGEGLDPGNACNLGASTARTYNSKSTHEGLFGFGWCSGLESTIRPGVQGLVYVECGSGQEVELRYTSPLPLSDIPMQSDLIARSVMRLKNPQPGDFENFRRDLTGYTELREKFSTAYDQAILPRIPAVSPDASWTAWIEGDQARIVGPGDIRYFRRVTDRGVERWVPTAMDCRDGRWWSLDWSDPVAIRLDSHVGPSIFHRTSEGRIRAIERESEEVSRYEYRGAQLVKVTNSWGNSYDHRYDARSNMVRATYPDGTSIQLAYDGPNDLVTRFADREGCTESYRYFSVKGFEDKGYSLLPTAAYSWLTKIDLGSDRFSASYGSLVRKTCRGSVTNRSVYAFGYRGTALSEVESAVNGASMFIRYDDKVRPRQFASRRIPLLSSINELISQRSGVVSDHVSNRLFQFRVVRGKGLEGTLALFGEDEFLFEIALEEVPKATDSLILDWRLDGHRGQLRLERQGGEISRVTNERGDVVLDSEAPSSAGRCFPLVPDATVATWSARFEEALSTPRDCSSADFVLTVFALSVNHLGNWAATRSFGPGRLTDKEAESLYTSVIGPVPSDPDAFDGFDLVMDAIQEPPAP